MYSSVYSSLCSRYVQINYSKVTGFEFRPARIGTYSGREEELGKISARPHLHLFSRDDHSLQHRSSYQPSIISNAQLLALLT